MSQRAVGRDRTRRARLVHGDKERARTEQETANFMREMEKIDYLHKPRTKGRMRETFEETLTGSLFHALEGNKQAEKILVGHKREVDRLDREATRETSDIDRQLKLIDSQIESETRRINLLARRGGIIIAKDATRSPNARQGTEVIETEVETANRRLRELQNEKITLQGRKLRIEQDTAREKKEAYDDVQRQLREAR